MASLSIPADLEHARLKRFGWAIRLSPLLLAITLAALWLAGAPVEAPDLRLSAPIVARPGSSIGVRAWHLDADDRGAPLTRAPEVDIAVRDARGNVVVRATLERSRARGAEGTIDIPSGLEGELLLEARARLDDEEVTVSRALYVREGIDSKLPAQRLATSFQVYEVDPVVVRDAAHAPPVIDPRIAEGACVPDLSCTLLVWLGGWEGRVRLRGRAGFGDASIVDTTGGFARFDVVVRGQEGLADVAAIDDEGDVLASRGLRIPLIPGGVVARAALDPGARARALLQWSMLEGTRPALVDLYSDRRWVAASSVSPDEPAIALPGPGVWRLQVRRDLYSSDTAAVAYVVAPDAGGPSALRAAAEAVLRHSEEDGLDPLAMAILDGSFRGDAEAAIEMLFAVPSFDVVAAGLGASSSQVPAIDEDRDRAQDRRRWAAAFLIVLMGLAVSVFLRRVERVAQARADRLLEELGDGAPPPTRRPPGRGLWALVLLVFMLVALLALSKRWF